MRAGTMRKPKQVNTATLQFTKECEIINLRDLCDLVCNSEPLTGLKHSFIWWSRQQEVPKTYETRVNSKERSRSHSVMLGNPHEGIRLEDFRAHACLLWFVYLCSGMYQSNGRDSILVRGKTSYWRSPSLHRTVEPMIIIMMIMNI
jgi:hypothetical protein